VSYFITGATGFIGKHLVAELAKRGEPIYVLVRPASAARFADLQAFCGPAGRSLVAISGDLATPLLGVPADMRSQLRGSIRHFFHLGAVYDLTADAAANETANVQGTANALALASDLQAGCFHLVSSIAAAGLYPGTFTEDMFDEAVGLEHPYFRTKHESEALVRRQGTLPWRVYRPAMVVGHSETGYMDKVDGPYYFFKLLQKLRTKVPAWLPLLGIEGGQINLVPVDFVARSIDYLAHQPGDDGQCFHLTDPRSRHVGEVLNLFAKAAHAPTMTLRLDSSLLGSAAPMLRVAMGSVQPLNRVIDEVLRDWGVPRSVMQLLDYPTRFDSTRTQARLAAGGIKLPALESYAWRLWDYWERHLDPDLMLDRSLAGKVRGKVVLITGGSSGIGRATALRIADAGARVVIVARDVERLNAVKREIEAAGGDVSIYSADLGDPDACAAVARRVLGDHGRVDVLINNAGKSIRRALANSYERFHDFERLMRINYFGAVRLTMALLPAMVEAKSGHVISISSIGVLANSPRFAAYAASKAALETFSNCAAAEFGETGVRFTVINMPLVRTPMTSPTRVYEKLPLISADEAAEMVCDAVIHQPKRVATRLGVFAQLMSLFAPKLTEIIQNQAYKMFPESEAARASLPGADSSKPAAPEHPTDEMIAFATILRGIHW
jgi:NAD(P)-dependent dehydrogenase (short-subunit alcohol dehydrogenase family)